MLPFLETYFNKHFAVRVILLCASVYCFLCGHLLRKDSWLSFVMSNCEFVTFPLVSWARCGT